MIIAPSTRRISRQKRHLGECFELLIKYCVYKIEQFRKEMEATWNQKGEEYKTQIEKIEEKLRNAELAVSKV